VAHPPPLRAAELGPSDDRDALLDHCRIVRGRWTGHLLRRMGGRYVSQSWFAQADARSPWPQAHVVVAGIGVSGFAAADGLLQFGARVSILDDVLDDRTSERGKLLEVLGGSVRLGPGSTATLPADADLVITTGWPATHPL